jgi:hypothetical protein
LERDRSPINREHDHLAQYQYSITEPTKSDGFDSDQARAIRRCGSALPEELHHSRPARVPWPYSWNSLCHGFHVEAAVERAHALL